MKKTRLAVAAILGCVSVFTLQLHAQPGLLDLTFNPGSGANPIYCMALQTNGQIIIGGDFTTPCTRVARLNADGSWDGSFYPGVGPSGVVEALALQSDGKIVIGGGFDSINGVQYRGLARLRPDGSVDISYGGPGFFNSGPWWVVLVEALAVQSDGKVIVGGNFNQVRDTSGSVSNWNCIARLNTNGTLDATFNPGTGIASGYSPPVTAVGLQSNGQIIVGGLFNSINGDYRNGLARLNTDGSVDTAFNALLLDGSVATLVVTPQDKIVIGGGFTSINGYSRNYIARLNADGSVDTTFTPGLGANYPVTALAAQIDGKVVIAGGFTLFNGTSRAGLARLNTNGTLDVTFNPGTGPNSVLNCVASQPDGKTLIGGSFTRFNGTNINGIARLNSDTSSTSLQFLAANMYCGTYLQGTVSNTYRIESAGNLNATSSWTPVLNVILQTNPQFILDPNPATGRRFYRAVQVAP